MASASASAVATAKSKKSCPKDMSLITSFARIKPLDADKTGGVRAQKQISSWDESKGIITFNTKTTADVVFDHMSQVIGPDATQVHVYETIAKPLIHKWLNGYDVDIISYGQTGSGKTCVKIVIPRILWQGLVWFRF